MVAYISSRNEAKLFQSGKLMDCSTPNFSGAHRIGSKGVQVLLVKVKLEGNMHILAVLFVRINLFVGLKRAGLVRRPKNIL